jgi:hypothetical protein
MTKSNMGRCLCPQASATNMTRGNGVIAITTDRAQRSARGLLLRSFSQDLMVRSHPSAKQKNFTDGAGLCNRVFFAILGV